MTRGPGRIERIMREEMEKLATHMEEKIKAQDEGKLPRLTSTSIFRNSLRTRTTLLSEPALR